MSSSLVFRIQIILFISLITIISAKCPVKRATRNPGTNNILNQTNPANQRSTTKTTVKPQTKVTQGVLRQRALEKDSNVTTTTTTEPRIRSPPPNEHITADRRCIQDARIANHSRYNCHGAVFQQTMGYFQPCNRHSHCYRSREPSEWCILPYGKRWAHWGCHCDFKLGSCVIERYDGFRRSTEWSYCTPKSEFYCATDHRHIDAFLTQRRG